MIPGGTPPLLPNWYRMGAWGYGLAIRVAAGLGNRKAQAWLAGRRDVPSHLAAWQAGGPTLWMHCASLGEFEQGRPLLEAVRSTMPHVRIVLTFFSPSGYEIRKEWPGADLILYLPEDRGHLPADFLRRTRPTLAVFVKYDLWPGYLRALREADIPIAVVAARYRLLANYMVPLQRALLGQLTHLFVQDEASAAVVLTQLGLNNVTVAGDPRFDRVATVAKTWKPIPEIEEFVAGRKCLVAGSAWPADEDRLISLFGLGAPGCLVLVPHELHEAHLSQLARRPNVIRFSQWNVAQFDPGRHNILLVDRIGLLSRIYHYASAVWIGGGFGAGIHNTLEAAVYGKPLAFGPRYQRFREAIELIERGAAQSLTDPAAIQTWWQRVLAEDESIVAAGRAAAQYVQQNIGATERILRQLAPLLEMKNEK